MRTSIKAKEGYVLTNGEIYGREIFLAEGVNPKDFYEITLAEYDKLISANADENQIFGGGDNDHEVM